MQTQLPPISENQLPHWSRVGNLDRARYPRAFGKDHHQHYQHYKAQQHIMDSGGGETDANGDAGDSAAELAAQSEQNPVVRIQYLERSIEFLRTQHREILESLHREIEKMQRENKDLQFRLVMSQKQRLAAAGASDEASDDVAAKAAEDREKSERASASRSHRRVSRTLHTGREGASNEVSSARESNHESASEAQYSLASTVRPRTGSAAAAAARAQLLEDQLVELRHQLREAKAKNSYLAQTLDAEQAKSKHLQKATSGRSEHTLASASQQSVSDVSIIDLDALPTPTTGSSAAAAAFLDSEPLVVRSHSGRTRQPTVEECERIIRHLQLVGEQQVQELTRLKADLKEALYSQKWTPDAFLLAKAYVVDDSARDGLPRLQMRGSARKLPDVSYVARDNVSLPALKQTMGTKAVERRRRTQILQKARLKKEVS